MNVEFVIYCPRNGVDGDRKYSSSDDAEKILKLHRLACNADHQIQTVAPPLAGPASDVHTF
jgi:hypothetical protein